MTDTLVAGVMLLRPSALTEIDFVQNVLPSFGIKVADTDVSTAIGKLFQALKPGDSSKPAGSAVTATPSQSLDWQVGSDKKLLSPLALNTNNRNRRLTNALWCSKAGPLYLTCVTISYSVFVNLQSIASWLSSVFGGLSPKDLVTNDSTKGITIDITLTKTTQYAPVVIGGNSFSTTDIQTPGLTSSTLTVTFHVEDFDIYVDLKGGSVEILLVPTGSDDIATMLSGAFNGSTGDTAMIPAGDSSGSVFASTPSFGSVHFWYADLDIPFDSGGKIAWQFGLLATINVSSTENLVLGLSYDSASQTFMGRTIFSDDLPSASTVRGLSWDPRRDPMAVLTVSEISNIPASLDLFALMGLSTTDSFISSSPALKDASIIFRKGTSSSPSVFSVHAVFTIAQNNDGLVPSAIFRWDDSTINVDISKASTLTTYNMLVTSKFVLVGTLTDAQKLLTPAPSIPTATFNFALSAQNAGGAPTWSLSASVRNLSVGMIAALFDSGVRDDGLELIQNLTLVALDVTYTFSGKQAASFVASGLLKLGTLALSLKYNRDPNKWSFSATLGVDSPGSTLADIVDSIVPGAADKLPEFVGAIVIDSTLSKDGPPQFVFEFKSDNDPATGRATILTVFLNIAGFSMTFVHFKTRSKEAKKGVVKRILRISVDQIPMMDHIPIVGTMPQPFDHLVYMWVEDDNALPTVSPPVDTTHLGISNDELADIRKLWPQNVPVFQVKDSQTADARVAPGHHFVVVVSGQVVLDHVFQTSKAETQPAAVPPPATPPTPSPEAQPTKGNTTTAAGILSVSALNMQYKQGQLIVGLDATLKLGPLTFSVIGFTISINLKEVKLDHLADIVTRGLISADLHGIQVGVTQGPLTLNGVFIHNKTASYESYSGGIAVGLKAWQVLAVGEYFVHLSNGIEDYKAVFV